MSTKIEIDLAKKFDNSINFDYRFSMDENILYIEAEPRTIIRHCPRCRHKVKVRGTSKIKLRGIPVIGEKKQIISLTKPRYYCINCNNSIDVTCILSPAVFKLKNGKKKYHHVTKRLAIELAETALLHSVKHASELYNINIATINSVVNSYIQSMDLALPLSANIGLDQFNLNHNVCCTVVNNLDTGDIIDILDTVEYNHIIDYFNNNNANKVVKFIVTDMDNDYCYIINQCIDKCKIVIDKFHVYRLYREAMWDVLNGIIHNSDNAEFRKVVRNVRDRILRNDENPNELCMDDQIVDSRLINIIDIDNAFHSIYNKKTKAEANSSLDIFIAKCYEYGGILGQTARKLETYKGYILDYFCSGLTNAISESNNAFLNRIKNDTCGSGFTYFRAKALIKKRRNN